LDGDWHKKHEEARDRRLQMPGVPHHQGSRNLSKYAKPYVSLRHCSNLAVLNSTSFLTTCCLSRSRMHTVASQLVNSRHMLWLTWARQRPTSSTTQMPHLRRTCNTPGVCHSLSGGFELKHNRLCGDGNVKVNLWRGA
jgi:hypothetical protein